MRHSILTLLLSLVVTQIAHSRGDPPGEIATLKPRGGAGFGALAFSPDGRLLASTGWGGKIRIWDVSAARRLYTLKVADDSFAVTPAITFSPDGKLLASAAGSKVWLWDVQSGKQQRELKIPSDLEGTYIECLAFRPDGKRLVGAGADFDRKFTGVISWDTGTGKTAQSEKLDGDNRPLQLSADGGSLAYFAPQPRRAERYLRVRDLAAKKKFDVSSDKPIVDNGVAFALSPDGKVAAIGDKLWDVTTDKELVTLKKTNELTPQIRRLFFSPDGKFVAAVGDKQRGETNDSIFLYDVKTGFEVFAFKAHEKEIYSLAITRNGQTMASTSADGTVKLWDLDP